MRRLFNFPWIYAAYLATLLYFTIWRFNWLVCVIFVISCGLACLRKFWGIFIVLAFVAGISGWAKWQETMTIKSPVTSLTELRPIADTIDVNGNLLSFRGKADGRTFQVYDTLKDEKEQKFWQNLDKDIELTFEGDLSDPQSQRNFNGFDYQKYLKTQNIYQILSIKSIKSITPESGLFDLHLLRRRLILFCEQHFPTPMSSYMTGLLFGYLGKNFDEMSDIYTSLGIIHLFALSGMQVNFFIDWLRKILLRLGMRRDHVDKLQIPFSIVYAFLTGLAVSVLRALLQKNIRMKGLDNFAVSFFVLMLIMPKFLLTTGGQLTMLYSFLIAMTTWKFKERQGVKKILLESTVLSVGVLPLLILDFHVFQPLSILLTFAFSFIFDVAMLPLLVILFVLGLFGLSFTSFNFLFQWLETLIKWVDGLFHYPLVLGTPSVWQLFAIFLVTGLLIDFWRRRKTRVLLLAALAALFFFVKNPTAPSITMVDIGQGDSFLLEDSLNHETTLIDTGGKVSFGSPAKWAQAVTDSNANKTLIPYLQSRGIGTLDHVILTHSDGDHCGDIDALADKIKIKEIWVSEGSLTVPDFVRKMKLAHTKIHVTQVGDSIPIFKSQLQVLSAGYTGKGDNNDSLVTYGNFFGKRWLFTGDLEREGEAELLQHYPSLKVDILKAGHHGSKTASDPDFIAAIQPQLALISCGLNNRYHHPNDETLETFTAQHIPWLRTDEHGAVRFDYRQESWQVETVK
ncbi:MAG: DNA internalization-related competence protein ComEC/Rec2 [Streptococcaceae bacterium]|jgi:competence protein ComEC|nr:DNA internalization-related competence protein ComEC/Rec2 [Streptococcaceae bacterium]